MQLPTHNPARFAANVPACHGCARGPICPSDGKIVSAHADAGYCPLGKFADAQSKPEGWEELQNPDPLKPAPPTIPLAGDLVAALTHKLGVDRAAKYLAKLAGKPDCGCEKRRVWLNRLDARLRSWLIRESDPPL
jgi:hypothetical protein